MREKKNCFDKEEEWPLAENIIVIPKKKQYSHTGEDAVKFKL